MPIEALPAQDQADVLRRIAGWLGPLGDSTAGVIPSVVPNGGGVTINVVVRNNFAPTTAWLTVTLPSGLDLGAEDLPTGFDIDAGRHTITWHGPLGAGQSQALALRAQANLALPGQETARPFLTRAPVFLLLHRDPPNTEGSSSERERGELASRAAIPKATASLTFCRENPQCSDR